MRVAADLETELTAALAAKQQAEIDRDAYKASADQERIWRAEAEAAKQQAEKERDEEIARSTKLAYDGRELEHRLAAAERERDEFKRIGQGFERDMRTHFDQSCQNLQRAERAEREIAALREDAERWREHAKVSGEALRSNALHMRLGVRRDEQVWGVECVIDLIPFGKNRLGLVAIGLAAQEKAAQLFAAMDDAARKPAGKERE